MIRSFADDDTATIWRGRAVRRWPLGLQNVALRKLRYLHQARQLNDLRVPPGNRLEALRGNRAGQFSIRVNDQWRLCFRWQDGDVYDVTMVDYH